MIEDLPDWIRLSFEAPPQEKTIKRGETLYRYGFSAHQLNHPNKDVAWIFMTRDRFENTEEAVEALALLDHTAAGTYRDDGNTRESSLVKPVYAIDNWKGKEAKSPWNTARWRKEFSVNKDLPAWEGITGAIAFDLVRGEQYTGAPNQVLHLTRRGGASQVVVPLSLYPLLTPAGGPSTLSRTLH
jgi:hypothetical protein